MAEAAINALDRHDMLLISQVGRTRIFERFELRHAPHEQRILRAILLPPPGDCGAPGIVRRCDEQREGIPVGFVHSDSADGRRFRLAAHVFTHEVECAVSPYELMRSGFCPVHPESASGRALLEIMEVCAGFDDMVGLIGSAAMELLTGIPYLTSASDLDFLVRGRNLEEVSARCKELHLIGLKHGVAIDVEISLANGYGVKAAELFSKSKNVLGKSLRDVRLLERREIERAFAEISRYD